jgi:hypothetical protein
MIVGRYVVLRTMKFHLLILSLLVLSSCSQQPRNTYELLNYVKSPARTDSSCREDVERAEKDIADGKIILTQTAGFLFGFVRYEDELAQLSEQHGLKFDYDMLSCIVEDGQTQGCYGATMENEIIKRFGPNFRERLHEQADSLFLSIVLANNKSIDSWDCDQEAKQLDEFKPTLKITELDIKKGTDKYGGGWPFMDFEFVIELDSSISNYSISNFVPTDSANSIYEQQLFALASNSLEKEYPTWVPGTIKSQPVRTNKNVRIFFANE